MASSGSGDSFARALLNAVADAAGGTVGRLKSYAAKGWHAQISKLTSGPRGYLAAEAAGLSVTARTLKAWLAEESEPNAANRDKIAEAYEVMAGRWPDGIERQDIAIHGQVGMGSDVRMRGGGSPTAPLLVDGRVGDWSRIKAAWNSGDLDEEDVEEAFTEDVLEADLGEGSEQWEFPGSAYTVVIG